MNHNVIWFLILQTGEKARSEDLWVWVSAFVLEGWFSPHDSVCACPDYCRAVRQTPSPAQPSSECPAFFFLITSSHHISLTFVSFSLLYWFNWLRWSPRLTLGSLLPDLSQGLEPILCPALSLSHETGLCARNTRVRVKNVYLLFLKKIFIMRLYLSDVVCRELL